MIIINRCPLYTGSIGICGPRTRNPISNVKTVDRLHGYVAQKRCGGEAAVEIHIAHHRGRFHNVSDRVPGRGPIRSGRVHQGNIVVVITQV